MGIEVSEVWVGGIGGLVVAVRMLRDHSSLDCLPSKKVINECLTPLPCVTDLHLIKGASGQALGEWRAS